MENQEVKNDKRLSVNVEADEIAKIKKAEDELNGKAQQFIFQAKQFFGMIGSITKALELEQQKTKEMRDYFTELAKKYNCPDWVVYDIDFEKNQITFGEAPKNPFQFINMEAGKDVEAKEEAPAETDEATEETGENPSLEEIVDSAVAEDAPIETEGAIEVAEAELENMVDEVQQEISEENNGETTTQQN